MIFDEHDHEIFSMNTFVYLLVVYIITKFMSFDSVSRFNIFASRFLM